MDQMEQNHIAQPSAGVDVIYSQEDAAPTSSIYKKTEATLFLSLK